MNFRRALYIIILFLPAYNVATLLVALTANQRLGSGECLPAHLRNRTHDDYSHLFKPFRWVPWSWTAWCFVEPPLLLLGNQKGTFAARNRSTRGPKPIQSRGNGNFPSYSYARDCLFFFFPISLSPRKRERTSVWVAGGTTPITTTSSRELL